MPPLTLAHLTLGVPPAETIAAAAAVGFEAVGIRICARRPGEAYAVQLLRAPTAIRDLKQRISDAGIRLSNISGYQFYPDVEWTDVEPVVETAAALGAPIIVVNGFDPDEGRFVDLFARYCDAAAATGIRVALEFLPYSAVRTLGDAVRILKRGAAANAGVVLDALHLERSGGSPADIVLLDPRHIIFAQLCDAMKLDRPAADEALMEEARTARLPPGTGALPLFAFLDALPAGTEIEYEVARADMTGRPALDKARVAHADAQRFMHCYDEHRVARRH